MKKRVVVPSLNDILDTFKVEIFRDFSCVKIGEIESYDHATASASIKLKIKEFTDVENNISVSYPILTDVPVLILQGGGGFQEWGIKKGDFCIVFFNDRDIDTFWTAGTETTPNSQRMHSLSDGIALVAINPKTAALSLTGNPRIFTADKKWDLANNLQTFSVLVFALIDAINSIVTNGAPTTQVLSPASKTALTTLKTNFEQLLGAST